jgi:hypothetical protein
MQFSGPPFAKCDAERLNREDLLIGADEFEVGTGKAPQIWDSWRQEAFVAFVTRVENITTDDFAETEDRVTLAATRKLGEEIWFEWARRVNPLFTEALSEAHWLSAHVATFLPVFPPALTALELFLAGTERLAAGDMGGMELMYRGADDWSAFQRATGLA